MNPKAFGQTIREARKKQGWTQTELAELVREVSSLKKCSKNMISLLENGKYSGVVRLHKDLIKVFPEEFHTELQRAWEEDDVPDTIVNAPNSVDYAWAFSDVHRLLEVSHLIPKKQALHSLARTLHLLWSPSDELAGHFWIAVEVGQFYWNQDYMLPVLQFIWGNATGAVHPCFRLGECIPQDVNNPLPPNIDQPYTPLPSLAHDAWVERVPQRASKDPVLGDLWCHNIWGSFAELEEQSCIVAPIFTQGNPMGDIIGVIGYGVYHTRTLFIQLDEELIKWVALAVAPLMPSLQERFLRRRSY